MEIVIRGNELSRDLSANELICVVNLFQNNPIRGFPFVEFEPFEKESFDEEKIISVFQNSESASFSCELYVGTNEWLSGSLSFDNIQYNIAGVEFSDKYLQQKGILEKIKNYLKNWRNIFPNFIKSSASSDNRDNEFWLDIAQTEPLPECFGSRLGWYHVLSQLGYKSFFKREDLLNAPVYQVEELTDGTICFQSYKHPLDYSNSETTEKIIDITNYLNRKADEFDPTPTVDVIDDLIIFKNRR